MTLRKYPLATLYTLLFFLSVLDYLTTIYCLENVPNCYETNPWFQTPDVMFKFKILYGVPVGVAGVLVGFAFDKIRMRYRSKPVLLGYFVLFAIIFAVFVKSCLVVANNIDNILRYG